MSKWLTGCLGTGVAGLGGALFFGIALVAVIFVSISSMVVGAIAVVAAAVSTVFGGGHSMTTMLPAAIHGMPAVGIVTAAWHSPAYYAAFGVQHRGVDIANAEGTPLYSTLDDGVVLKTGFDPNGYGYYVKLGDKASGYSLIYGHLQGSPLVSTGDTVHYGQLIGLMGQTGNATGVHVHYEVRNPDNIPVDPAGSRGCCG